MDGQARRALCAVIGSFSSGEQEPAPGTLADIPDAGTLRGEMVAALRRLGYDCTVLEDDPPAAELGAAVRGFLAEPMPADGLRIVHVLSHGAKPVNIEGLEVCGGDGEHDEATDVEDWLKKIDRAPDAPATLVLLDVCRAGTATRLPHQLTIGRRRSVVLAASAAADPAYDANFTRAVITALTKVADGRYDVARGFGFVSPDQVARDIETMVAGPGHGQQVTSSLHSLLDDVPRFPFFPNLTPHDADQLPEGIDPGIGDLAVGLDPAHFIDRAYASGLFPRMATGLFQGRDRLLQQLSAWLDGTTASAPAGPPAEGAAAEGAAVEGVAAEGLTGGGLRVVTGSPGSGKSALLGVLVCAAHPQLRTATDPAWNRLAHVPSRNQDLVAVHARQLTTQQVIDSLARQLRLPPPSGTSLRSADTAGAGAEARGGAADAAGSAAGLPAQAALRKGALEGWREGWSMQDLLDGITAVPTPPVVVIDALDEAAQPTELLQLLLQLADRTGGQETHDEQDGGGRDGGGRDGQRDGGGCRLLVGTRRWRQFSPLLERARAHGGLIDLDDEPAGEVRRTITGYVTALLARQAPYDTAAYANARPAFADGLATALTTAPLPSPSPQRTGRRDSGPVRWPSHPTPGPFGSALDGGVSDAVPDGVYGDVSGVLPGGVAEADDPGWGPFLVAALYTHHKVTDQALPADPAAARARGAQVPLSLPEVMEMDLQARRQDQWARPLLAACAFARGDGMPLDTLMHVAPVFHPDTQPTGRTVPNPTFEQAQASLANIRFYLRLTPDHRGVIHYRLFHQGLTDYLRHHPTGP